MDRLKKLDRWAEKLLDTGKRNNLINYRDYKTSSAEVVFPDCDKFFSKCTLGRQFSIYDPHIVDDDILSDADNLEDRKSITKSEYIDLYSKKIKNEKTLLLYSHGSNPIAALKRIAKKAKDQADETGINVAYLAFGFIRWNEREGNTFYKAPLLLVHINIITGSIFDPIKIEISDDDIVVNPTFSYYLKAEYGFKLPEIKDDESLVSYYSRVMRVVGQLDWDVIDECKVGVFSFLKINMYEDIKKNAEHILNNSIIKTMVGESHFTDFEIDDSSHFEGNPLIDLHTVIEADSSQIDAIEMAKQGKSFVLQGPPGTGKSQTITNIIAECLYDGKKVLFVSEKQAALNVVYDKLKKADLADFCLELHSHKANKKAVIDELNRTLELSGISVSAGIQNEIEQKKTVMTTLDSYEHELHKKRDPINKSLFELIEEFSAYNDAADFKFSIPNIEQKNEAYLYDTVNILEQYVAILPAIGYDYTQNTWYGFTKSNLSYDETDALLDDLEALYVGLGELQQRAFDVATKYEANEFNYIRTKMWSRYLKYFGGSDVITPALLKRDNCEEAINCLNEMKELSSIVAASRKSITDKYISSEILDLDGVELYRKLTVDYKSMITRCFNSEYKNTMAKLQANSINNTKIKYQDAIDLSQDLIRYQSYLKSFVDLEKDNYDYLGSCYNGMETDWDYLLEGVNDLFDMINEGMPKFDFIRNMSKEQFMFSKASIYEDGICISVGIDKINDEVDRVKKLFDPEVLDLEKDSYSKCISKIRTCIDKFDHLTAWKRFKDLSDQLNQAEISDYIEYLKTIQPEPKLIVNAFKKAFYKRWIDHIMSEVPELGGFSRRRQENAIDVFKTKDKLQYEISKIQINAKLSKQRPNVYLVPEGSAVDTLLAEGQKKRKQMSIRRLLAETGSVVQTIKPCFMMSPLSVSTFLDSDRIRFDTVVFDEASQIFPQDALGAIYRGKQLIVVGDSKQMPPSNFFSSSSDSDEDDQDDLYDITDFESILDVCSAVFDTQKLSWHYRSRYEQLIAFSNANFYNNTLVTFPSATKKTKGVGVDYYYVDGVFDRPSKTNLGEAKLIVDLIYDHIKNYPDRSLGVVAFSVAQQSLIDKLLTKKRETSPEYEWFFADDRVEPFFIKNLETVQGDERDTIIFSIAYAHDENGRFYHNFGPLNREGGERRLNVAVTRAKENVQLVSSIRYTDINLNNTRSEGVRLLRSYLEYAQNGELTVERDNSVDDNKSAECGIENEICKLLRERGFAVDTKIGCSEDRIDIGIREGTDTNYFLAIECDGQVYHNSRNTRDRDSLRQRVLENMGWKYYRVWSTEWYKDKESEQNRLMHFVWDSLNATKDTYVPSIYKAYLNETAQMEKIRSYVTEVTRQRHPFDVYTEVGALSIINNNYNFVNGIREILATEAPLSEEYLLKRIVTLFDREKVTKVVVEQFDSLMYSCRNYGIKRKNGYMYLQDATTNVLNTPNSSVVLYKLRVPGSSRDIKYIAPEELAGGMYYIIRQNDTVTKDGLYKFMTNVLGFSRTGDNIVEKYDQALSILTRARLVKKSKDRLSLVNE